MKHLKFSILLILSFFFSCKESNKKFETEVEIRRISPVRFDAKGDPLTMDLEISYYKCPGDQYEVIRAGHEFTDCIIDSRKIGDKVIVELEWGWSSYGFYEWEVKKVGGCERVLDPNDEASFNMVQECEDLVVFGVKVGFSCDRVPNDKLQKECPWFRKE